ncbi:MAG TPA: patatin-like phospholipase family protein [Candidatus Wallbacteria bacterium]|nr:patatin-like phospholipase family protein [Candidatus Wallbacteria bacterium]
MTIKKREKDNIVKFNIDGSRKQSGIGLALGSGAVRGAAHVGIITELLNAGIEIHEMSGSSIGAVISCIYGAGLGPSEMKEAALEFKRSVVFDYRFPFLSFCKGDGFKKFLSDLFIKRIGITRLEQLKTKVFVVCADIINGRPIIFSTGGIVDILAASCAVPMLFPPRDIGGTLCVDGGVLLPVPSSILRGRKNDMVVGVNLGFGNLRKGFGDIFRYAGQTIVTLGRELLKLQKGREDLLIEPDFGDIGYWQFEKIEDIINIGRTAAKNAVPEILKHYAGRHFKQETKSHFGENY